MYIPFASFCVWPPPSTKGIIIIIYSNNAMTKSNHIAQQLTGALGPDQRVRPAASFSSNLCLIFNLPSAIFPISYCLAGLFSKGIILTLKASAQYWAGNMSSKGLRPAEALSTESADVELAVIMSCAFLTVWNRLQQSCWTSRHIAILLIPHVLFHNGSSDAWTNLNITAEVAILRPVCL